MMTFLTFFAFTGFGTLKPGYLTGGYDPADAGSGLATFIKNSLNAFYVVAGLAVFVYLIIAGFRYVTASGDQKALQDASKQISGAVTGIAVIIVSYAFVSILSAVLGVPIFNPTFKAP